MKRRLAEERKGLQASDKRCGVYYLQLDLAGQRMRNRMETTTRGVLIL